MEQFLLIASDVHSDEEAFEKLMNIAEDKNCLAFLYAGDLDLKNPLIEMAINNKNCAFLPVLGNCDSPWMYSARSFNTPPLYRNCQYNGLKINISHGHVLVPDEDAKVVITGHTHIPRLEQEGSTIFLNPGSAGLPRGYSKKSYAKIEFIDSIALIKIYELESNKVISSLEVNYLL